MSIIYMLVDVDVPKTLDGTSIDPLQHANHHTPDVRDFIAFKVPTRRAIRWRFSARI